MNEDRDRPRDKMEILPQKASEQLQKYVIHEEISHEQARAIHLEVVQHYSQQEIADDLGMAVSTINGWVNHHEAYKRIKNEYQQTLREASIEKSVDTALNDILVDLVMDAYESGDTDKAIEALKATGVYGEAKEMEERFHDEVYAKNDKEKALLKGYRDIQDNPYATKALHFILSKTDEGMLYEIGKELKSVDDPVLEWEIE